MESPSEMPTRPNYLVFIATAMLIVGVGISLFVLQEAISIYFDVDSNSFLNSLTEKLTDSTLITFGEHPVVLGVAGAKVSAFVMLSILAWISIYLAATLIAHGAQIITPDVYLLLKNLKWKITELKRLLKSK